MTVGSLGGIVFEVSDSLVNTVKSLSWSGSANYATHSRHGMTSLTEFVGLAPEKISFDIYMNAYLGVDPQDEFGRLRNYMSDGRAMNFILGNKRYGRYKWNITSLSLKSEQFDHEGDMISATASITLQEYVEE